MFLSERLDSSWDQDKGILPLHTSALVDNTPQMTRGDEQDLEREIGTALGGTGWQGREEELALEVI